MMWEQKVAAGVSGSGCPTQRDTIGFPRCHQLLSVKDNLRRGGRWQLSGKRGIEKGPAAVQIELRCVEVMSVTTTDEWRT